MEAEGGREGRRQPESGESTSGKNISRRCTANCLQTLIPGDAIQALMESLVKVAHRPTLHTQCEG
jgi:hypothetical protein